MKSLVRPIIDQCRFCIPCFLKDEKEKKPRLVDPVLGKVFFYKIKDMVVKELVEVKPVDFDHGWNNNFHHCMYFYHAHGDDF